MSAPFSLGYTGFRRKATHGRKQFLRDLEGEGVEPRGSVRELGPRGQANVDAAFGIMRGEVPPAATKGVVDEAIAKEFPQAETAERGVFRGLTPEERRTAVFQGMLQGWGSIGGISRGVGAVAEDIRRQKALAPFEEAVRGRLAETTDPRRRIELQQMLAATQVSGSPTYYRPRPNQLHQFDRYEGGMIERNMAVAPEPPELGSPEWQTSRRPIYKPGSAEASAAERRQAELAEGVRSFLLSADDPAAQANIVRYVNPTAWRAYISRYGEEASALVDSRLVPGGRAGGAASPPASEPEWESWRQGKPGVPPFSNTSPEAREFFYRTYGAQAR